jgi:hypothetical protein
VLGHASTSLLGRPPGLHNRSSRPIAWDMAAPGKVAKRAAKRAKKAAKAARRSAKTARKAVGLRGSRTKKKDKKKKP